jgi:Family of unknown function (DUF6232)
MTIYYRAPDVQITHEVFHLFGPPRVKLRIDKLRDPYALRGDLHPARVMTSHLAGGMMIALAASWPHLETSSAWLAVAAPLVGSVGISEMCRQLCPRIWELRARYGELEIQLYQSADRRRFNAVARGLGRALQDRDLL